MDTSECDDSAEVFEGWIIEGYYLENDDALFVGPLDEPGLPLAMFLEEEMEERGCYLSVRYWITDGPRTVDELDAALAMLADGEGYARYLDRYSEITGYLWTSEDLEVGGHDLLEELRSHVGKWCRLEVGFSKVPQA